MNEDLTVTDLPESEAAPETAKEGLEKGTSTTLDSSPLRKFFYGNDTNLSDKDIEDLNFLWGYHSQGSNGPGETLGRIRDLERTLSQPPQGVSRLQHLLSYTRLLQDESDLKKEKSAYYG